MGGGGRQRWATFDHIVVVNVELLKGVHGDQDDAGIGVDNPLGVPDLDIVKHGRLVEVTQGGEVIDIGQQGAEKKKKKRKKT